MVDLLDMLPSDHAFLTVIRNPRMDIERRCTLVVLRDTLLRSTRGVLRSTWGVGQASYGQRVRPSLLDLAGVDLRIL